VNPTRNITVTATPAVDTGSFDPRQAAALLDQTTRQTRRRIEPYPAWLYVIRAFIALAGYGAVWLSVRGQHPYHHPTAAVIPVVAGLAVVNLIAVVTVARRATAGVAGRSRLRPAEIAIAAVAWIGVFAVLGVLAGAGVSHSVVYGTYPAAAPLMAAGLAWAGIMAARRSWRPCGAAAATAVVGAASALAGPAGAWAVAGAGLCAVLLASAAVIARRQRRSVVRP
jgi:hypothetical protein